MTQKKNTKAKKTKAKVAPTPLSKEFKDNALSPRKIIKDTNHFGRKILFRESMFKEGQKLGALGFTLEEIADFWGIHRSTLHRWTKKNPDFCDTIKRAGAEADSSVLEALLREAKVGNMTGIIFWLKNRRSEKWKDRKDISGAVEHSHVHFFEEVMTRADEMLEERETNDRLGNLSGQSEEG